MRMQIFVLFNTCGLMAVCAVVYSHAQMHIATRFLRRAVVGLAFGLAGVATMLQPLEIEPGIFADARGAFVGMAMAFGGPVAAAIAVFLTVSVRLSMGGPGALIGASVIIATCPVPDDHIDPRRTSLFVARSILREVRNGRRAC